MMSRVLLEHNLDAPELAASLAMTIMAEGISHDVGEILSKSHGEEPVEPEVRDLLDAWTHDAQALCAWTEHGVDQLIRHHASKKEEPSLETVCALGDFVLWSYLLAAGLTDQWPRHRRGGWIKAGLGEHDIRLGQYTAQAYLGGRLHVAQPLSKARRHLHSGAADLKDYEHAAYYARLHAGAYISGVGHKVTGLVVSAGVEALQRTYQGTIAWHLREMLDAAKEGSLAPAWQDLSDRLRAVLGDEERERDLDRIARTEIRLAWNHGVIQSLAEEGTRKIRYSVGVNACALCKRTYLNPDGSAKTFNLGPVLRDIARHGGLNYGRSADRVRPSALLHPNCQCSIEGVGE